VVVVAGVDLVLACSITLVSINPALNSNTSITRVSQSKHTPKDLLPTIPIRHLPNLHRAIGALGDAEFVLELVAVQGRHVQERIVVLEGTVFANCIICRMVLLAGWVSCCIG
jgi:hypothetical protein